MFNYTEYLIGMCEAYSALDIMNSACSLNGVGAFVGDAFPRCIADGLVAFDAALVRAFGLS
jgi:hypothetical protein